MADQRQQDWPYAASTAQHHHHQQQQQQQTLLQHSPSSSTSSSSTSSSRRHHTNSRLVEHDLEHEPSSTKANDNTSILTSSTLHTVPAHQPPVSSPAHYPLEDARASSRSSTSSSHPQYNKVPFPIDGSSEEDPQTAAGHTRLSSASSFSAYRHHSRYSDSSSQYPEAEQNHRQDHHGPSHDLNYDYEHNDHDQDQDQDGLSDIYSHHFAAGSGEEKGEDFQHHRIHSTSSSSSFEPYGYQYQHSLPPGGVHAISSTHTLLEEQVTHLEPIAEDIGSGDSVGGDQGFIPPSDGSSFTAPTFTSNINEPPVRHSVPPAVTRTVDSRDTEPVEYLTSARYNTDSHSRLSIQTHTLAQNSQESDSNSLTQSWLLDPDTASASPTTTLVPRDLDRFPRGSSPALLPSHSQATTPGDEHLGLDGYPYTAATTPPDIENKLSVINNGLFLSVSSQHSDGRPQTEQSVASFHTAHASPDNSVFDEDEEDDSFNEEDEGHQAIPQSIRVTQHQESSPEQAQEESVPHVTAERLSLHARDTLTGEPHQAVAASPDSGSHSTMSPKVTPHPENLNLTLRVDSFDSNYDPTESGPRPKSPVGKISSFFGWKSSPRTAEYPTTPLSENPPTSTSNSPATAGGLARGMDQSRRPSRMDEPTSPYSSGSSYSLPYDADRSSRPTGRADDHVDDLIKELREVSTELAASIKREMDLEDELDRARTDMPTGPSEHGRRGSDYFSDSGASSVKNPATESGHTSLTDTKIEGLERMRRKAEQEKAQIRLDMTNQVQEDLNQRRALEMHVQSLEEQLQSKGSGDRKDLESSLEDTKRRLNEERQFKQNFEDLVTGMREELEGLRSERDNLRDEIVPQLKSRLDGLEAEALEKHNLTYENARMQQELQSLRNENQTLVNARKMALELQQSRGITDDEPGSPGLARSGSLARSKSTRYRAGSVSNKNGADKTGEDSFKDLEDQRDALHQTLKSMVLRHDNLAKNHAKRVRVLEVERDRASVAPLLRRGSFGQQVSGLRGELNELRTRVDDALEQKWQCEKGLSGLKMDLDRAKQETSSLRELLQDEDMFTNSRPTTPNSSGRASPDPRTLNEPLEKSQAELQNLSANSPAATALLPKIKRQLELNQQLRKKLAVAIERGVREQAASEDKINELQTALRKAEEGVIATQQSSEDAISSQEVHMRNIRETKAEKDRRGVRGIGKRVPAIYSGKPGDFKAGQRTSAAAGSNPSEALFALRSPRLDKTSSGEGMSVAQAGNTVALEKNLKELEREATRADRDMQGVIEKMNRAQLEVAELQAERDESIKETRKLQREIIAVKGGR